MVSLLQKVQRLDEFSEASKTLCHAKYVLRCERSKKKREKLRMKMKKRKRRCHDGEVDGNDDVSAFWG